jgi:hypothetical protein
MRTMAPSEFPILNSDIHTKWFQSLDTDEALHTATRTCTPSDLPGPSLRSSNVPMCLEP